MFDIKTKLLLRKINKQLAIFISAVFITALAVLFFVAVKTLYRDFKLSAENYFENNLLHCICKSIKFYCTQKNATKLVLLYYT